MTRIQIKQKVGWEQLLFDFDFLKHFGYNHWSALSNQSEQTGFLLDPQNRFEIKQGSKFIARFRANELTNDETLFPLYQTVCKPLDYTPKTESKIIMIIQMEKGLIGKYNFEADLISINDLTFEMTEIDDLTYLSSVSFKEIKLAKKHDDTIIVGTKVMVF
jgi:hypothetical protein